MLSARQASWLPLAAFLLAVGIATFSGSVSRAFVLRSPGSTTVGDKCAVKITDDCPAQFRPDEDYKLFFRVTISGKAVGGAVQECLPGQVSIKPSVILADGSTHRISQGATLTPSAAGSPYTYSQTDFEEIYTVVIAKAGKYTTAAGDVDYAFAGLNGIIVVMQAIADDGSSDTKTCTSTRHDTKDGEKCRVEIKPLDTPRDFIPGEDVKIGFRVTVTGPRANCLPATVNVLATVVLLDGTSCKITVGATLQPSNAGMATRFTQNDYSQVYRLVLAKSGMCTIEEVGQNYTFDGVSTIALNVSAVAKDAESDLKAANLIRRKQ